MRLIAAAIMIGSTLSACGQSEETPPPAPKEVMVRSDMQKQLFEANQLNRAIALKRAIRDFGAGCVRVTKSGYVGRYEQMDYWTATCQDDREQTREWALFIGANDSVQIRLCEDVAKVDLPGCTITEGEMVHEEPATTKAAG